MILFSTEDLIKNTDNSIYKLVILAARRAIELNGGMPRLIEGNLGKNGSVALEEIKEGKIKSVKKEEKA